jgi:hypothetical protein
MLVGLNAELGDPKMMKSLTQDGSLSVVRSAIFADV